MKQIVDKHRKDKQHHIRDLVYVKLHPGKQILVG